MAISADRRKKVLAILAGGAVLGVGAAITLAAWNDSEFATGTFTAGSFTFTGSVDGTNFSEHATEGAAAVLTFAVDADNMTPGDVVYAGYALRVTGDYDADLTHVAPVISGANAANLTAASVATATFGCDAAAFTGGTAVPTTMVAGTNVYLCLQVTAGAGLAQGDSGTILWQWDAESTQP